MAQLTAPQAAARLGIKKATLYAYVSRGLLHRRVALDGRTSLFDAAEVDALRSGRRRIAEGEVSTLLSTAITEVADESLRIRGHDLVELVLSGHGFETVAELLWNDDPPPPDRTLPRVDPDAWGIDASLAAAVAATSASMPPGSPGLERLRVAVAVCSSLDPLRFDLDRHPVAGAGRRTIRAMVVALGASPGSTGDPNQVPWGMQVPVVAALWPRLTSDPSTPERSRALDAALALLADHGLAASTFAARIAASVRADPYSVVAAGLGVLGGSLHGAASAAVHRLYADAHATGDPVAAVGDARRRLGFNPGFGHQVYRRTDPRCTALGGLIEDAWDGDLRLDTVREVGSIIAGHTDAPANVDLALGSFTWLAGMDDDAGEVIFAIARTAGWLAHALEEFDETPLRFRPRARFSGPSPQGGC